MGNSTIKNSRFFCIAPWSSITVAGNGDIKPCCTYDATMGNVHKGDDLITIWNSPKFIELRRKILAKQEPPGCRSCYRREQMIGTSRRLWLEDKFGIPDRDYGNLMPDPAFIHIDLNFANLCNYKCRMCSSTHSSSWYTEDLTIRSLYPELGRRLGQPVCCEPGYFSSLLDHFDQLERIDFKGGEPMVHDKHFDFLEMLIESGRASEITLVYVTNGSKISLRCDDVFPHFKEVKMIVSVDGTGELYKYIRSDTIPLEEIVENLSGLQRFYNLNGLWTVTTQVYNIFNLPDILDFIENNKLSNFANSYPVFDCTVTNPAYLRFSVMPKKLKNKAVEILEKTNDCRYNAIIQTLLTDEDDHTLYWDKFRIFAIALDEIRGTDLRTVVPLLGDAVYE